MQFIVALIAFAVVLALANANVDIQAKKVKVGPSKAGNAYLNVWFYGSSDCSGKAGLAVSVPNRGCWIESCARRLDTAAARAKVSAKASAAISKIFPKQASEATRTKMQNAAGVSLGFSQNTIGGEATANAFAAMFTDLNCTTWVHDEGSASFAATSVSDFYTLDTCINGDSGYPYKLTFTSTPAVPSYDNGYIALSAFNDDAKCNAGAFGSSNVSPANGLDIHFFYPLDTCNWQGEKASISGGIVSVQSFDNNDCTGTDNTTPYGPVGVCDGTVVSVDSFGDRCAYVRLDEVPAGKKKGTAKASSLRM